MEQKYWIKGEEVWGDCHSCGTPTKFADIIRMSKKDVEAYKAIYSQKEVISPIKFLVVCIFLYSIFWFVLSKCGYSPVQILNVVGIVIVTGIPLALITGVVWTVRESKREDTIRATLLKKYGREVGYPKNWTRWSAFFFSPENILILPEGVTTLPED